MRARVVGHTNRLVLVVFEGALIADAREGGRSSVAIADGAFAIAFVAEAADGDAYETTLLASSQVLPRTM
jgi:hypothetical protein